VHPPAKFLKRPRLAATCAIAAAASSPEGAPAEGTRAAALQALGGVRESTAQVPAGPLRGRAHLIKVRLA
jgi:hypothetical protein